MSKKAKETKEDTLSSQILEYYRKYSGTEKLPLYFCGASTSLRRDDFPEPQSKAPLKSVGKSRNPAIVVENVEDICENVPAVSPASSVASNRKLEWDNGADIGYDNCNVEKVLKKSSSLPTVFLEDSRRKISNKISSVREAVLKFSSSDENSEALPEKYQSSSESSEKPSEKVVEATSSSSFVPEKISQESESSDGFEKPTVVNVVDMSIFAKIGKPMAESTPFYVPKFSEETIGYVETPMVRKPERMKPSKISSGSSGWNEADSSNNQKKNSSGQSLSKKSSSVENLSCTSKKTMKEWASQTDLGPDKPLVYLYRPSRKKHINLCLTKPISVECLSNKLCVDKIVQTSIVSSPVEIQTASSTAKKQKIFYATHEDENKGNEPSSSTQTGSDALVSECDSFEYLYGAQRLKKSSTSYSGTTNSNRSEEVSKNVRKDSSNVNKDTSSSISGPGSKRRTKLLASDVEKSVKLLQKLVNSTRYDDMTKKYYMKKIVRKIIDDNALDDSELERITPAPAKEKLEERHLQGNIPWVPAANSSLLKAETFVQEISSGQEELTSSSKERSRFTVTDSRKSMSSLDWREEKTLSEMLLEGGKSGGDHIANYAKNERRNQLNWVKNEIQHLNKLKKLLTKSGSDESQGEMRKRALEDILRRPVDEKRPRRSTAVYMITTERSDTDLEPPGPSVTSGCVQNIAPVRKEVTETDKTLISRYFFDIPVGNADVVVAKNCTFVNNGNTQPIGTCTITRLSGATERSKPKNCFCRSAGGPSSSGKRSQKCACASPCTCCCTQTQQQQESKASQCKLKKPTSRSTRLEAKPSEVSLTPSQKLEDYEKVITETAYVDNNMAGIEARNSASAGSVCMCTQTCRKDCKRVANTLGICTCVQTEAGPVKKMSNKGSRASSNKAQIAPRFGNFIKDVAGNLENADRDLDLKLSIKYNSKGQGGKSVGSKPEDKPTVAGRDSELISNPDTGDEVICDNCEEEPDEEGNTEPPSKEEPDLKEIEDGSTGTNENKDTQTNPKPKPSTDNKPTQPDNNQVNNSSQNDKNVQNNGDKKDKGQQKGPDNSRGDKGVQKNPDKNGLKVEKGSQPDKHKNDQGHQKDPAKAEQEDKGSQKDPSKKDKEVQNGKIDGKEKGSQKDLDKIPQGEKGSQKNPVNPEKIDEGTTNGENEMTQKDPNIVDDKDMGSQKDVDQVSQGHQKDVDKISQGSQKVSDEIEQGSEDKGSQADEKPNEPDKEAKPSGSSSCTCCSCSTDDLAYRVCPCCKNNPIGQPSQYSIGGNDKPTEAQIVVCNPCYTNCWQQAGCCYQACQRCQKCCSPNPAYMCQQIGYQIGVVQKMKTTIRELDRLEKKEEFCRCMMKNAEGNSKYCTYCGCKLLKENVGSREFKKGGMTYLLTIDTDKDKKDSDKEIKKKKDCKCKKHKKSEKPKISTLQECLVMNKPGFIQSAEERRKCMLELMYMREQRCQKYKQLLALANGLPFPNSLQDQQFDAKRLYTTKEMRAITAKRYKSLPEVQQKFVDERERQLKTANRLLADIFNKKLRECVLKGKVNLSTSVSVINLM